MKRISTGIVTALAIVIYASSITSAQDAASPIIVKGLVVDNIDSTGLPAAQVALVKASDSSVVKGVVAGSQGEFVLRDVAGRQYLLKVTYTGYQPNYTDLRQQPIVSGVIDVGEIRMVYTQGDEITVEARRRQVEYSAGKKVFNVDENLTTAGSSALEVLKQVPGVNVDLDGNITLRGSAGVNIMIDNKPASNYGNITQVLQSLPASILSKVEVVTNPNAKYDAQGQSGIINIVMKKQTDDGVNGMLTMAASALDNYGTALTTNVRQGSMNYFVNGDYNSFRSYRIKRADTKFDNGENLLRDGFSYYSGNSNGVKAGADIGIDSTRSMTVFAEARWSDYKNHDPYYNTFTNTTSPLLDKTYLTIDQTGTGPFKIYNGNFDFVQHLGAPKHDLNFNAFYSANIFDITSTFINTFTDAGRTNTLGVPTGIQSQTVGSSAYWQTQADYLLPINDSSNFEAGLKATFQHIDSKFNFSRLSGENTFVMDSANSNGALHQDNVFAAYINYSDKFGPLSMQLGLRGEHTTNDFVSRLTPELGFYREFGNLFPNAAFSYGFEDYSSLNLSYSKRINRPHATLLNPFLDKSDSLNWRTGNPRLTPEYTHSFELGYLKYFERLMVNVEAFYRVTTNMINMRFREQIGNGSILQEKPYNFGQGTAYGMALYTNSELIDGLNVNTELSYFYQKAAGTFNNQSFNSTGYAWNAKLGAVARLPYEIMGQLNIDYTAPQVIPQGYRTAWYMINLAFNREFLDKRLTIGFNWTDIFNTARMGGSVTGTGFSTVLLNQRDYNLISLNVSYKINDFKGQRPRAGQGGAGQGAGTI